MRPIISRDAAGEAAPRLTVGSRDMLAEPAPGYDEPVAEDRGARPRKDDVLNPALRGLVEGVTATSRQVVETADTLGREARRVLHGLVSGVEDRGRGGTATGEPTRKGGLLAELSSAIEASKQELAARAVELAADVRADLEAAASAALRAIADASASAAEVSARLAAAADEVYRALAAAREESGRARAAAQVAQESADRAERAAVAAEGHAAAQVQQGPAGPDTRELFARLEADYEMLRTLVRGLMERVAGIDAPAPVAVAGPQAGPAPTATQQAAVLDGSISLRVLPVPDFDRLLALDAALGRVGCVRNVALVDYTREAVTFRIEMATPTDAAEFGAGLASSFGEAVDVRPDGEGVCTVMIGGPAA